MHHVLDTTFDEDRGRTGHGPEDTTLLRRFAIGLARQCGDNAAETHAQHGAEAATGSGNL